MLNNFKETLADIYTGKDATFIDAAETVLINSIDAGAFNCKTLLEGVTAQAKTEADPKGPAHALAETLQGCKHLYPSQKADIFAGTHRYAPQGCITASDMARAKQEKAKEHLWKKLDKAMSPLVPA